MAPVPTKTKPFIKVPPNTIIRWGKQWMEVGADKLARPLEPNDPTGVPRGTALGIALGPHLEVHALHLNTAESEAP